MKDPRHLVAVFGEELINAFAVDALHLVARTIKLPTGVRPPFRPLPGVVARLKSEKRLVDEGGRQLALFTFPGFELRLSLGIVSGRPTRIGASITTNVLRRLRTRLAAAGLYSEPWLARGARSDNYLDLQYLAPGVDLHKESLIEVLTIIEEARSAYVAAIKEVFGFGFDAASIRVAIRKVELSWDVASSVARHAVTAFEPAWRAAFPGAGRRSGFFEDEDNVPVISAMATKHRQSENALGTAVLRADTSRKNTHSCKLYPKHHHLIRFEAVFVRQRAKKLLGWCIRVASIAELDADLCALAVRPYAALMEAQEHLHCDTIMHLRDLLELIMSAGKAEKVLPIFDAFFSGAMFHNPDEEFSDQLGRLRDRGAVHFRGGLWAPEPLLAHTLHILREYVYRHASAPTPSLPAPSKGSTS